MQVSDAHQRLIDLGRRSYAPNYRPRDVVFESGCGSELFDVDDRRYLDFGSGIGVNCLGHRHPAIVRTLQSQANRLWHASNVYFHSEAVNLSTRLIDETVAEAVYFCNSGAEANEAAIKVARRWGSERDGQQKHVIITLHGSFHGRTLGALTATAQTKYQVGFGPLLDGFRYCRFDDLDDLEANFSNDVCALMFEPVQGESGVRPLSSEFVVRAAELCEFHDALLIVDEIQCGMGRTGQLFGYQRHAGVVPDIITVAKALGAGLPIGAALLGEKTANVLQPGSHGTTFGGNPLCCAVASTVLNELLVNGLIDEIPNKGALLANGLEAINRHTRAFSEIRAFGLMIGAQLTGRYAGRAGEILLRCLDEGLLVLQSGDNVLRLLPAYTISEAQIHEGLELLSNALVRSSDSPKHKRSATH